MKNRAMMTAAALLALLSLAHAAQAQAPYPWYNGQSNIQYGVPSAQLGGATIYPDGSFSNNGYSWNGADPAGGWRGNVTPVYQAAPGFRTAPVYYGNRYGSVYARNQAQYRAARNQWHGHDDGFDRGHNGAPGRGHGRGHR